MSGRGILSVVDGLGTTDEVFARVAEVLAEVVDDARTARAVDPTVDTGAVVALSLSLAFGTALLRSVGAPVPARDGWDDLIGRLVASTAPPERDHDGTH